MSLVAILALCVAGCVATIFEIGETKYGRCLTTGGQFTVRDQIVTQLSTTCTRVQDGGTVVTLPEAGEGDATIEWTDGIVDTDVPFE